MTATPVILANGSALDAPSSATESATIAVGQEVALSLQSTTGFTSFEWIVTRRPFGSTATLGSTTGFTSTFTPDEPGEYRFRGLANGGETRQDVALIVARTRGRGLRKAKGGERLAALAEKYNAALDELDLTARVVNVKAYGAVGDGTTDDTAAITAAIATAAQTSGQTFFPEGEYRVTSTIALPADAVLVGASQLGSVILCGHDGTLFTCDDDNRFMHLTFDGQGATYTSSKLFTVAGTKARQRWWDCALINAGSYCVEFIDETAGSQSTMLDCRVYRYNGSASGRYAIKIKDTGIVTAVPRKFIGCESDGGKFIDLGGCNNVYIGGGYIAGVLFSSNSRGVWMNGVRLADPAGANLAGFNHNISGCDIAGPGITIESGTSGCKVSSTFNAGDPVTDNSGQGGANMVDIPVTTFTPTVTSSGAAVNLGSGGDVRGQFSRSGAMVHVDIEVTWGGAGLSVPAGFLEFSLPSSIVPRSATIQAPCGSGYTQQGASTKLLHAVAFPGTAYLRALTEGGGYITNINPWSWASGNVIRLSITYTL